MMHVRVGLRRRRSCLIYAGSYDAMTTLLYRLFDFLLCFGPLTSNRRTSYSVINNRMIVFLVRCGFATD